MKFIYHLALILLVLRSACSSSGENVSKNVQAQAAIAGSGITGTFKAMQTANGFVWVAVELQGDPNVIKPGLHGIHIHEKGVCEAQLEKPFSSAGGHFDPGPFGSSTPVEKNHPYHLGDLQYIKISVLGKGRMETFSNSFTLSDSPTSLFDSDGSAVILHKLVDQKKAGGTADEAGGGRQACGVIQLVKS